VAEIIQKYLCFAIECSTVSLCSSLKDTDVAGSERNIPSWLTPLLIIGGIWAANSILYDLTGLNFLWLALEGISLIDG